MYVPLCTVSLLWNRGGSTFDCASHYCSIDTYIVLLHWWLHSCVGWSTQFPEGCLYPVLLTKVDLLGVFRIFQKHDMMYALQQATLQLINVGQEGLSARVKRSK